ncbi:MFS transporter [Aquabacterium sp. J223]|uniref:CynX/NimT family MFS transporter n=1 Tax=Aquabacterium sp. J223 TaxID=2898431 RepID=UPI0021AE0FD4|nr:MFS transporter [Aquabacterium sp. J223]UUX95909.1 MFS transporter [Aquabacterium sp. J223]
MSASPTAAGSALPRLAPAAVLGVLLVAVNLRAALMGVGPLLKELHADTGLAIGVLGLLVTMPLLAFALVSPLAPAMARRLGLERTLAAALALLAAGIVLRSLPGSVPLFAGSALLGSAIAVGNVLLPALVRRDFPARIGVMTSVFVTTMAGTAAVGVGLAVPLAQALGWRLAMAIWAVPALLGALWWATRRTGGPPPAVAPASTVRTRTVWRSPLAWQVTAFMGLQSLAYYVMVAWLPTLLRDAGLDAVAAGQRAFVYQVAGLAGSVAAPLLAGRAVDQRPHAVACALLILVGNAGLLAAPQGLAWLIVQGLGSGGSLAVAMALFGLRSRDPLQAAALSGMAQSVGYGVTALGPVVTGLLHDATGHWQSALWLMCALAVAQAVAGWLAGRPIRL